MNEARVCGENEQCMLTAPPAEKLMLEYGASKADLPAAMAKKRRWRKKTKKGINVHREAIASQYGHINLRICLSGPHASTGRDCSPRLRPGDTDCHTAQASRSLRRSRAANRR